MVDPADRHDELVAHTAPECTRLCKGEMMRIRRHAAADEACLSQHESQVILIVQANRFSQSTDCIAARLLFGGPHRFILAGSRVRRAPPCALRYPHSALNDRLGRSVGYVGCRFGSLTPVPKTLPILNNTVQVHV